MQAMKSEFQDYEEAVPHFLVKFKKDADRMVLKIRSRKEGHPTLEIPYDPDGLVVDGWNITPENPPEVRSHSQPPPPPPQAFITCRPPQAFITCRPPPRLLSLAGLPRLLSLAGLPRLLSLAGLPRIACSDKSLGRPGNEAGKNSHCYSV